MESTINNRRYDIDWLRVIAIGLLLIYHIAVAFQPWGVFIGFIQSDQSIETLWAGMSMLNIWRIPLLFFVSGMGVCFSIRKRDWKQILFERSKRILLPFIFGIVFIVPLHIYIWQIYYSQDLSYTVHPSHLWFLANIFIYVVLLFPLFFYLRKREDGMIRKGLKVLFSHPLGLLIIVVPFMIEAVVVQPETFEQYAMTPHGFILGLLAFFFGFCFVLCGDTFWNTVFKWRWLFLFAAAGFYVNRLYEFNFQASLYLMAIESNMWIFAVFGFGFKHLNYPSNTLRYLSQGAYPIYIIHMIFLYLGCYLVFPLEIPVTLKFVLVVTLTAIGCSVMYEFVIRRINLLRPLFGLKTIEKETPVQEIAPVLYNNFNESLEER